MHLTPVTRKEASLSVNMTLLDFWSQILRILFDISSNIGNGEALKDFCIEILEMYGCCTLVTKRMFIHLLLMLKNNIIKRHFYLPLCKQIYQEVHDHIQAERWRKSAREGEHYSSLMGNMTYKPNSGYQEKQHKNRCTSLSNSWLL